MNTRASSQVSPAMEIEQTNGGVEFENAGAMGYSCGIGLSPDFENLTKPLPFSIRR
jgi:hypothetical protein